MYSEEETAKSDKKENPEIKALKKKLFYERKNVLVEKGATANRGADTLSKEYIKFLNAAKTERNAVKYIIAELEKNGFVPFNTHTKYYSGDKVYVNNRGKAVVAAVIGKKPVDRGVSILAAHIDSPRIDLKQVPLYESEGLALFKTHYYGGLKKYQWTAVPLSLQGTVTTANGNIDVNIGELDTDPVFVITDLLPHLSQEQDKRTGNQLIKGEELNILTGSVPYLYSDEKDAVKLNILNLLNIKYGITEADFISAELSAVPAFKAREAGLDRSFVAGYGQDDRVCAYIELAALINASNATPDYTAVAVFADKEETGSNGNTGLQGAYLKNFIADLGRSLGAANARSIFANSLCLSADVNAAFDPTYPDVLEKNNAVYIGKGAAVTKFTGSRGKYGTSDASAETVGRIRKLFDENGIVWQTGELGKVDNGGGGTVALHIAELDVDTIDIGVPVLSMHSPYEVTA
ncbi:MAG: aminopeptidase, partial [Oscillospiraceae bacterium]|nr:aminopeptidase [Oscillospiraceae bacterium]